MATVSIIITTHNRPALLPRAIESARAAGRDIEIVVVDDASADDTASVCRAISDINYVRIERNQGVAGARNVGLVASSGEYLSFLDDDDLRLPHSIDRQVRLLEQAPDAGMIYAQAIARDAKGAEREIFPEFCPQGDLLWELLVRNFIPSGSVVFRRECLAQVGLLDESIPGIDDWDLWIRIAELFPVLAVETPAIVWRRSTPASAQGSSATVDLIERGRRRLRQEWLQLPRVAAAERTQRTAAWRAFSENIAEHLAWESFSALRLADPKRAAQSLLTLSRLHPSGPLRVIRRWTATATVASLLTTLIHRDDLPRIRTQLKQIRSNTPRR